MAWTAHKDDEYKTERFDDEETLELKLDDLAKWIKESKHFVIFTGAGISTSAGIPDFRGPEGVWTLKAEGKSRTTPTTSPIKALPTVTHMALVKLFEEGILKYLISQNCDGIHRRSGVPPLQMSELHGNGNIEECEICGKRYLRDKSCYRLFNSTDHFTGRFCNARIPVENTQKPVNSMDYSGEDKSVTCTATTSTKIATSSSTRICGGRLLEWTIDFGQNLPVEQLERAWEHASRADLHLVLGSSLTVSPACDMPRNTAKKGGRLVIGNLQLTPLRKLALNIHARTDVIMKGIMKRLNLEIPMWKLRRKFFIRHKIVQNEICIQVNGIDPNDASLPATLFPQLEFKFSGKKQYTPLLPSWYKLPSSPSTNGIDIKLRLHFMRHYGEPPLTISCKFIGESSLIVYDAFYDLESGEWKLQQENSDLSILSQFHNFTFPELQATSVPIQISPSSPQGYLPCRTFMCPSVVYRSENGKKTVMFLFGSEPPYIHALDIATWTWSPVVPKKKVEHQVPFVDKPRWGHSACIVPQWSTTKVLLFGGWDSEAQYNDLWTFDCDTGVIEEVKLSSKSESSGPSPRAGHSATAFKNSMIIFGGSWCSGGPYKYSNSIYYLDLKTMTWLDISDKISGELVRPRAQHSSCLVWDRYLLVTGGQSEEFIENDIYCFDTVRYQWHRVRLTGDEVEPEHIESVNFRVTPTQPSSCMVDDDNVLLIGFGKGAGVYLFRMSTCSLTAISLNNLPPLVSHAVALIDNMLVLYGGYNALTKKEGRELYKVDLIRKEF